MNKSFFINNDISCTSFINTQNIADVQEFRINNPNVDVQADKNLVWNSVSKMVCINDGSTDAATVNITDTNTDDTYYPIFVDSAGTSKILRADVGTTPISVNPNTGDFTVVDTIKIDQNKVGIGKDAGKTSQGDYSVAIGTAAGLTSQGIASVAIGNEAGQTTQGIASVAIGLNAGNDSQGSNAIAVGNNAGKDNQGEYTTSIGLNAGEIGQGEASVAIGSLAGQTNQGTLSVAIGNWAARTNQGNRSVAIGLIAGDNSQGTSSVAIGDNAGTTSQSTNSVAIGTAAGQTSQSTNSVAIGTAAGNTSQGGTAIAIGNGAGNANQEINGVAIGNNAGNSTQGVSSIGIGTRAGESNQGNFGIGIGQNAGQTTQGFASVAVGNNCGVTNQDVNSIAIGNNAGNTDQGFDSIAMGQGAGNANQSNNCIAMGANAGNLNQGSNAIAIGFNSAPTSQPDNSIVINATGVDTPGVVGGSVLTPLNVLPDVSGLYPMYWNSSTGEVSSRPTILTPVGGVYSGLSDGVLIDDAVERSLFPVTSVGILSIPANGFTVGDSFSLICSGDIPKASNADVITIKLMADAVELAAIDVDMENTSGNVSFFELEADFQIRTIGATGTVITSFDFTFNKQALKDFKGSRKVQLATIDTTSITTLGLTAKFDNAGASEIQTRLCVLKKIY